MFFFFLHLFVLVHLCASYLFPFTLCSIQSTSTSTAIVIMQFLYSFPCHISLLPRHATFCFFFHFSLFFSGHCSVDLGHGVSASRSRPLQFISCIERSHPSPMLAFPRSLSPYPHCTLRSCPGTPTCPHLRLAVKAMNSGVRPTRNLPCHATGEGSTDSFPQYTTAAGGGAFLLP